MNEERIKELRLKPRDWYYIKPECDREALAKKCGVVPDYLRKVMTGEKKAGRTLAVKLAVHTPYPAEQWRPDLFGETKQLKESAA